ncbi:DHA2 family multidrug resistance protein-like MFS transporter [Allocatelliglobosispora scoriae]|uniref:DHA2 family multidrug resistance protein-like MFS transporter n=1 Tax=Allocatelliglobosispora scoriae TaxID=643052 RepID=A0A841BQV3_9ACTN|nr:MFS transporter [Allocatelliglobosispora scoriae]MBB5869569.1 DHA2 family multidrug resistance protein-like MFS transporter [Allocatelliglobosispora scoriae]
MSKSGRWTVLAVLCASLLLVALDATILNVALPSLIDDLHPDAIQQLWIIDIYGLLLGGLLVTAGAVGDRWGRKRLFLVGVAAFGIASIIAATSSSPGQLIAGRVLLACGGAMIMPSTLSLIRNVFSDPQERTRAIGVWASVAGAGAAIGPVLGGLLVERFGWAAAFWVNVPIVVITLVAGWFILPESRTPGESRLDWFSAALSVAGTITIVWGIKHVAADGVLSPAPLAIMVGLGLLIVFARRQLRLDDPLLDVRLFTNPAFTGAAITTLAAMMAIGAALFLLSLWLQYVEQFSPLQAGLRMLPAALATLLAALATPRLVARLGVRTVIGSALATLTAAFAILALAPLTYPVVVIALVAFGIGDGMAITAAATTIVSAAPAERAGGAAAVNETCYELGVGFGVAILGSIAAVGYRNGLDGLRLPPPVRDVVSGSIGGAHEIATDLGGPAGERIMVVARAAYVDALTLTSVISAVLVAAATVVALWLIPGGFQQADNPPEF